MTHSEHPASALFSFTERKSQRLAVRRQAAAGYLRLVIPPPPLRPMPQLVYSELAVARAPRVSLAELGIAVPIVAAGVVSLAMWLLWAAGIG